MLCYYHGKNATGICQKCGKYICNDCLRFTGMSKLCPQCYIDSLREKSGKYNRKIAITTFISCLFGLWTIALWILMGFLVSDGLDPLALIAPGILSAIFILCSTVSINYRMKRQRAKNYLERKSNSFH